MLHLSVAMTGQSVIKHFLTEGDKFLVSKLSPLADQGGYAVASNYGTSVNEFNEDVYFLLTQFCCRFSHSEDYISTYRRNFSSLLLQNSDSFVVERISPYSVNNSPQPAASIHASVPAFGDLCSSLPTSSNLYPLASTVSSNIGPVNPTDIRILYPYDGF